MAGTVLTAFWDAKKFAGKFAEGAAQLFDCRMAEYTGKIELTRRRFVLLIRRRSPISTPTSRSDI